MRLLTSGFATERQRKEFAFNSWSTAEREHASAYEAASAYTGARHIRNLWKRVTVEAWVSAMMVANLSY